MPASATPNPLLTADFFTSPLKDPNQKDSLNNTEIDIHSKMLSAMAKDSIKEETETVE